jgi:hypothetical protein
MIFGKDSAYYSTDYGANGYTSGTNYLGSDYDYINVNGGWQAFGGGYYVVPGTSGAASQTYTPYSAAQNQAPVTVAAMSGSESAVISDTQQPGARIGHETLEPRL